MPSRLAEQTRWMLVEYAEEGQIGQRVELAEGPTTVGRSSRAKLTLTANAISKQHAQLEPAGSKLLVRDFSSTNGTYVNGRRVHGDTLAGDGDLVQFATVVFRISAIDEPALSDSAGAMTVTGEDFLWSSQLLMFERMMSERLVTPHFQQIVELRRRAPLAYEVLARGSLPGLEQPYSIFSIAARVQQEQAFSEMMRTIAIEHHAVVNARPTLFLNTHPKETSTLRLLESLVTLREAAPELKIAIEVHEGGVTAIDEMRRLRAALNELGMQLAYDDFGAGQARLLELTEVPPDVLKFDRKLIQNLDTASKPRREIIRGLIAVAKSMDIITLAEGVETEAEHEACLDLGFEHGQGYLYGRPSAALAPA
ncbi:EAL domain-containing protein [Planctomycetaceae bacterium SH139]